MITEKQWKKWKRERDQAAKSLDVETFKEFYNKWKAKGVYDVKLPPDSVIEITMHKMVYHMNNATPEEKQKAKEWLKDRGYSTDIGG